MAMGKPVVVPGERGLARVFQPSTLPLFLRQRFWGIGDRDSRENAVASLLVPLLEQLEAAVVAMRRLRAELEEPYVLRRTARDPVSALFTLRGPGRILWSSAAALVCRERGCLQRTLA